MTEQELLVLKDRVGYNGKPQQFKYGFDLAIREVQAAQQKEGFVLVPVNALREVLHTAGDALMDESTSSVFNEDGIVSTWYDHYHVAEQQLISALEAQEPT